MPLRGFASSCLTCRRAGPSNLGVHHRAFGQLQRLVHRARARRRAHGFGSSAPACLAQPLHQVLVIGDAKISGRLGHVGRNRRRMAPLQGIDDPSPFRAIAELAERGCQPSISHRHVRKIPDRLSRDACRVLVVLFAVVGSGKLGQSYRSCGIVRTEAQELLDGGAPFTVASGKYERRPPPPAGVGAIGACG